jgi:hypothetical protein
MRDGEYRAALRTLDRVRCVGATALYIEMKQRKGRVPLN